MISFLQRIELAESSASNLDPSDTNGVPGIFVYDRITGSNTRLNASGRGRGSSSPSLSADGRYLAYNRYDNPNIYVLDRQIGVSESTTVGVGGQEANAPSYSPSIDADGRFVAFSSLASNLTATDMEDYITDVFVYDRQAHVTTKLSTDAAGGSADGESLAPAISADGQHVAFYSFASNLVAGETTPATPPPSAPTGSALPSLRPPRTCFMGTPTRGWTCSCMSAT